MMAPVNVTMHTKITTTSMDFVNVVPPPDVADELLKNPGSKTSVNICHIPAPTDANDFGAAA